MVQSEKAASIFGVTAEQVRAQYAKNAKQLRWMADKARSKPNGMYNGNSAAWYDEKAALYARYATGDE